MKFLHVSYVSLTRLRQHLDTGIRSGLDELSHWLQSDEQFGHAILFFLIFLTTFRKF